MAQGAGVNARGMPPAGIGKSIATQTPTSGAQQVNSAYHRRVAFPNELGNSTSRQLQNTSSTPMPALIVPVGSTEQHGPHLPLDTDTRIAEAVSQALAARLAGDPRARWLVAPAIAYGASGEHEDFPGTVSIGTPVLAKLVVEFARSACRWASRLVFVNGHGGNVPALREAAGLLRYEARDVAWSPCAVAGSDAHAGHTETSVLLHISPEAVRQNEWAPGNRAPLSELMPAMRLGGVAAVSSLGVLGDPTTASARDGGRIFAGMVDACVQRVGRWEPDAEGMLR